MLTVLKAAVSNCTQGRVLMDRLTVSIHSQILFAIFLKQYLVFLAGYILAGNILAGNILAGNILAGNILAGNILVGNIFAGNYFGW